MNKVTWYSNIAALIIFVGVFFLGFYLGQKTEQTKILGTIDQVNQMFKKLAAANVLADKPENAVYTIDGKSFVFLGGKATGEADPNSVSVTSAAIFGEPVYGDLNDDGVDDATMFIQYEPGGSGTFYYVAIALNVDGKFKGTNAVLLGDRVAPQTVSIENEEVVANYADRKADEPMTTAPSVGISKYLKIDSGVLKEVSERTE